ncbi:FHA domain-containing protein [Clostridium estertheticum]|uniref:FHA domain-containing protein n=1 Tax=Clostridium estertheticum TaxID=238834 RepID=UPI001C0B7142|nr:FHA domain-containing protein [Clostridium estertheticum]MBU3175839.1 FHA domain-containing protein [Clostridium estertheticum]
MNNLNLNNKKENKMLLASMGIINLSIGVILSLVCVLLFITIKSMMIKSILATVGVLIALIGFIRLFQKHYKKDLTNVYSINEIALVNEENEIIKKWETSQKTGIIIGRNSNQKRVDIDLSESIYSNFIEEEHAVINFAGGAWYLEDICSDSGVSIQKIEDGKLYRLVNNSPCKIRKGDILFIGKTKLLLR